MEEILKTDKPNEMPFVKFVTIGQIVSGMYSGSNDKQHLFKTDVDAGFLIPNTPEYQTINEALKLAGDGDLIKIEFLGSHNTENRFLFEVSRLPIKSS